LIPIAITPGAYSQIISVRDLKREWPGVFSAIRKRRRTGIRQYSIFPHGRKKKKSSGTNLSEINSATCYDVIAVKKPKYLEIVLLNDACTNTMVLIMKYSRRL